MTSAAVVITAVGRYILGLDLSELPTMRDQAA